MIRFALLLLVAVAARAAEPLDVEAILDHHAAAHGLSREEIAPGALHTVAELEGLGLSGSLENWSEAPLRTRSRLILGPLTMEMGFDGNLAWFRDRNGAVREAEAQERNGLLLEALIQTGAYALRTPPIAIRRSASSVDSNRVLLVVHPLFGDELRLFLDAYSHRVIESSWHNGQFEESTSYDDHRWYDGLLLPREMRLVQGSLELQSTLIRAERIESLGPEFYAMPGTVAPSDIRLAEDGSSGRLPMLGDGMHILLAGRIGDREGNFLLDTGAGSNVLNAAIARELGLVSEGEFEAIGVAGLESASFVQVESVRLGEFELLDQSWAALEFGSLGEAFGGELLGVLGYDTFSRLIAHVDYAGRSVEFLDRSRFQAPQGASALVLRLDMNVPTVQVDVEGKLGWMHVDTGSDNTIDLAAPFVERHGLLRDRENLRSSALRGVGGVRNSMVGELRAFEIGPFRYEDVTAYFHEPGDGIFDNRSAAGIVGAGILADYELWFDYADRKLWLRRAD